MLGNNNRITATDGAFLTRTLSGWAQDMDLLRHPRVCGARGDPQQGPRHLGRLLVPRGPHVRAPDWHSALHRDRPHENLQHHPQGY